MAENYISQLSALLQQAGLTQTALARRLGVTHAALSRWLHGQAVPHPRRQQAIAALHKTLVGFRPLPAVERRRLLARARALRVAHLGEAIHRHAALRDELLLEHTYNSNAIEGSTLSKRETETVIFDRSHVPDRSLREHLEATNHATVLREIFERKYPAVITESLVRQLHKALLHGIREDAGEYATHHRVIRGVHLALTHPRDIPEEMRGLLARWRRAARRDYAVDDVAEFHAAFELIHPFGDGNGRVGRLLLIIQLLAKGYPPVVIEQARKAEYYDTLEHAQRASTDPLIAFLVDEMERTAGVLRKYRLARRQ